MRRKKESRDNYITRRLRQMGARCDCGGPQYGTDHSPDCALVLAWDQYAEEYGNEECGS